MIQDQMTEPEWADSLGEADQRGLTPLFTVNMTPYGEVLLRPDHRLEPRTTTPPVQPEAAQDTDQPGGGATTQPRNTLTLAHADTSSTQGPPARPTPWRSHPHHAYLKEVFRDSAR